MMKPEQAESRLQGLCVVVQQLILLFIASSIA